MRAAICRELGPPANLKVEEVPEPELAPGELRVRMRAAGVNFPDMLMVAGGYQLRPPLPFTPGMEGAGEIVEVGSEATGWQVGDRVIVRKRPGTYAEQIVVSADAPIALPEEMDFAEGAAFMVGYRTAYHSLVNRANLQAGEVLLVHGAAGGVGLAAVELGKLLGARVIATASSAEKLRVCAEKGADHPIDYRDGFREQVKELTDGNGADVIYDPVGGDVFDESLRCIAWGGRLLVVGFTSGRIPSAPANYALLKGASIVGCRAGEHSRREPERDAANIAHLLELAAEGKLSPHISHRLPLESAAAALALLAERKVIGKAVLTMD